MGFKPAPTGGGGGTSGRILTGTTLPNLAQADGAVGLQPGDTYYHVDDVNSQTPKVFGEYTRTT